MASTVPGFNLLHLDSSTRPAELNVRSLDALVAGMGYRAAWRFRDVSRDAKGLGTSSKLRCYVGLRIVTLSKNLIKYENRYSQIFNIGYRELHATYMDCFFFFFFNDPPQPDPQIK